MIAETFEVNFIKLPFNMDECIVCKILPPIEKTKNLEKASASSCKRRAESVELRASGVKLGASLF
jgi:hypothetical protein